MLQGHWQRVFWEGCGVPHKGEKKGKDLVEGEILAELSSSGHPSSLKLNAVGCGVLRHRLSGRGLGSQGSLFWRKNQEPGDVEGLREASVEAEGSIRSSRGTW